MVGNLKVILWDIDGTILNTGGAGVAPLINAFKKYTNVDPSYDRHLFSGLTDHQIIKTLLIKNQMEAKNDLIDSIISEYEINLPPALLTGKVTLLNNYFKILNKIESTFFITNAIATGNTLAGAKIKLESVGLKNNFQYYFCSRNTKPRSFIIAEAIKTFPAETKFCVIGDTPHDIEAAKSNNIPIISVASGAYTKEKLVKFEPQGCLEMNWTQEELENSLERIFDEKNY